MQDPPPHAAAVDDSPSPSSSANDSRAILLEAKPFWEAAGLEARGVWQAAVAEVATTSQATPDEQGALCLRLAQALESCTTPSARQGLLEVTCRAILCEPGTAVDGFFFLWCSTHTHTHNSS